MKTLFLALLMLTATNDHPMTATNVIVALDTLNTQVTINTTSSRVEIYDPNYAGVAGQYFIGNTFGKVPYVNIKGGFSIADPALAKAIDTSMVEVLFSFLSTTTINKQQLPINIRLISMGHRASKL